MARWRDRSARRFYIICYIIASEGEALKRIVWHGDSLERIRSFPDDARQDVGYELERVQRNLGEPRDWKPMNLVGAGVVEIRVHARGEYRVFYVAKWKDFIHVCTHSRRRRGKPGKPDIELAAKRYREAVEEQVMAKRQQGVSDNVFEQLGFKPEEALNLRIRSEMMNALIAEIEKKGLTQAQAATLLGVSEPRISDLMRGKLHLFSIDTLVALLSASGLRVEMKVRKSGVRRAKAALQFVDSSKLAERVGFEPTLEFPLNTLSKRAPSTTRPSLRLEEKEAARSLLSGFQISSQDNTRDPPRPPAAEAGRARNPRNSAPRRLCGEIPSPCDSLPPCKAVL